MKTFDIILSQFQHINSNIRKYFIMALPLIIGWSLFLNKNLMVIIIQIVKIESGNYILTALFTLLILFFLFYQFRYAINVHRFIISQENFFFLLNKNFKVTVIYFLKFLIIFIFVLILFFISSIFIVSISNGILEEYSFSNRYLNVLGISTLLDVVMFLLFGILFSFVLSFLALVLPQAAIGKKITIIETVKNSKNVRLTLFFQALIIYIPYIFLKDISSLIVFLAHLNSIYLGLYSGIIFSIIYVYLITLYLSCLSKTYLLLKKTNK